MFAVHAWCRVPTPRKDKKSITNVKVKVFTRLGGVFVGWVTIKAECTTLLHRVQDLQSQVAHIFRHPTRTSNYLKLFINNFELPSFTYHNTMWNVPQTSIVEATKRFSGDPESFRLECMYDEDDTKTLKKLASQYPGIFSTPHTIATYGSIMPEVRVLKYTHDPKQVMVLSKHVSMSVVTDLSVLASFTNLHFLALSRICVESWEFANQLSLKSLVLMSCKYPRLVRKCFPSLEELCVDLGVDLGHATNFVLLERLDNLKTITFGGKTQPSPETLRYLSTSFPEVRVVDETLR
jgi:hypothetical protein